MDVHSSHIKSNGQFPPRPFLRFSSLLAASFSALSMSLGVLATSHIYAALRPARRLASDSGSPAWRSTRMIRAPAAALCPARNATAHDLPAPVMPPTPQLNKSFHEPVRA